MTGPSANPNDITHSNPSLPFLAPVATGPWQPGQRTPILYDIDPPKPPTPPAPPAPPAAAPQPPRQVAPAPAPRKTNELAVFGWLSAALGAVGMAVAVGTGQGQVAVALGIPFLIFVFIWGQKHPAQAAALSAGLAVYNHESNVRHARKMADLNARLGPGVVTKPQPWLTVAQASGQPTGFQMGTQQANAGRSMHG